MVTAEVGLPAPGVLLGVSKYQSWYPGQESVFRSVLDWYHGPQRFLGLSVAAGSGKSLNAILAAKLFGVRTCILTVTKGLQEQYMRDVSLVGGVNVKGRNNFQCRLVPGVTVDDGPCHDGMPCRFRQGGCGYYDQLARAVASDVVVTNYAYYLAQTRFSTGLGKFGLLVCDEGHLMFGALESHLSVWLTRSEVESLGVVMPRREFNWIVWQQWAKDSHPVVAAVAVQFEAEIKRLRSEGAPVPSALSRSARTAKAVTLKLAGMGDAIGRWVVESRPHGWSFTPVWVAGYGGVVYQDVPKVVVMSALLSPKSMSVLGVPEGYVWLAKGSSFSAANTPTYHVATSVINYRSDDYGLVIWLSRIDQIIQRRQDRKGIIFTVSYDRARLIVRNSRYAGIMITHSTGDVVAAARKFKEAAAPAVLVSPAMTSGWDFPEADYIIVAKIPYPDTTDAVVKARKEDDPDWPSFIAMETLTNESARGTRSITDKCEVLIVDDAARWFMHKYRHFAPQWFLERYRGSLSVVPEPLV